MSISDNAAGQVKDQPSAETPSEAAGATSENDAALHLSMDPEDEASAAAPNADGDALRAEFAEIAGIAAQAARLGVTIDVAEAVKTGVKPDALRQRVLQKAAENGAAQNVIAASPHPANAATKESPLVARAKAVAEGQAKRH